MPEVADRTASTFWGTAPRSAWWFTRRAGQWFVCAMSARAFLRALKWRTDHLVGYIAADDSGRWNADWSTMLRRHLQAHGWESYDVPVAEGQVEWTRDMLTAAIWTVTPGEFELVSLPENVQLPQSNVIPPDDGTGDAVLEPECWALEPAPAPAPTSTPETVTPGANTVPWPGGGGSYGGGGATSTSTPSTPAAPAPRPAAPLVLSPPARSYWGEYAVGSFFVVGVSVLGFAAARRRRRS